MMQVTSIAGALEVVGGRWTLPIIGDAVLRRFDPLQRRPAQPRDRHQRPQVRLDGFVESGIMQRRRYSEQPRAVRMPTDRQGPSPRPALGLAGGAQLGARRTTPRASDAVRSRWRSEREAVRNAEGLPVLRATLPPPPTWDDGRSLGGSGQLQAKIGHRCEAASSGKVRSDEGQRPGAARNPFATSTVVYGSRCRPRAPARFAVPVGRKSGGFCAAQFTVAGVDAGSRS